MPLFRSRRVIAFAHWFRYYNDALASFARNNVLSPRSVVVCFVPVKRNNAERIAIIPLRDLPSSETKPRPFNPIHLDKTLFRTGEVFPLFRYQLNRPNLRIHFVFHSLDTPLNAFDMSLGQLNPFADKLSRLRITCIREIYEL